MNIESSQSNPRKTAHAAVDLAQLLDNGAWGKLQIAVVALAALAVILDGFDNQLLGLAVPALTSDWNVARSAFAPVFAVGLAGMLIGAAITGSIGDRFGRRPALVGSVFVFGAATLGVAFVSDINTLTFLRLISGIGLGGAIPMAGTMTSEFTPLRGRALAVSLTIVCVPAGGAVAGAVAAAVLQEWGWRTLFAIGGAAALLIGILLVFSMPESPRFLARCGATRRQELLRLLLRLGFAMDHDAELAASETVQTARSGFSALLEPSIRRNTLSLWLAFVFGTMSVYMAFNWLPSLLTSGGLSIAAASSGLAAYNTGGVIGPILCASFIGRLGSRVTLLATALSSTVVALILGTLHPGQSISVSGFAFGLGVFGFFVNATQTMMYALAAHLYPTGIRATAVSVTAGVGRTGAIISSYIGAMVIHAGHSSFFNLQAAMTALTFVGLILVTGHIPRLPTPRNRSAV